jgi:hypothetical protein
MNQYSFYCGGMFLLVISNEQGNSDNQLQVYSFLSIPFSSKCNCKSSYFLIYYNIMNKNIIYTYVYLCF